MPAVHSKHEKPGCWSGKSGKKKQSISCGWTQCYYEPYDLKQKHKQTFPNDKSQTKMIKRKSQTEIPKRIFPASANQAGVRS